MSSFLHAFVQSENAILFGQLSLAMFLGALLGLERSIVAGKTAGVRTYALVSIGACLFIIAAAGAVGAHAPFFPSNMLNFAAGIVTGIGFLGAGLIIKAEDHQPHGLTTAAGLWVAAGIGMAIGFGLYLVALFVTFLTLFVFNGLWFLEHRLMQYSDRKATLPR